MKLLHLSDLHLGKRIKNFPLLEDQAYILQAILEILDAERPDAVLIAGDVYDRATPSTEAVELLDRFLVSLAERGLPVLLISGNHDSPERLAFGAQFLEKSRIFISPVYNGTVTPVTLEDEYGPVDFYLLPFLKPLHVRRCFPEEPVESYTEAVACAVSHLNLDPSRRNVLITHQFVTGAERCDSEEVSVGGSDNVDAVVFAPFDYVALGHLHGPQNIGDDRIRYCGTPLKYSFSESRQKKSVTLVELSAKGQRTVRTVPLTPRRDMVERRGCFQDFLTQRVPQDQDAYIHFILTDESIIPDAMNKLRTVYPNVMGLDYDNQRTQGGGPRVHAGSIAQQSPLDLFAAFYAQQNGVPLSEEQTQYLAGKIEQIKEEEP